MATGLKSNNMIQLDGVSWEDKYAINAGSLTNANRSNFAVFMTGSNAIEVCECTYLGSGALTLAEFNAFPIGSRIYAPAITTPSIYMKTGATTWKSQAINT